MHFKYVVKNKNNKKTNNEIKLKKDSVIIITKKVQGYKQLIKNLSISQKRK